MNPHLALVRQTSTVILSILFLGILAGLSTLPASAVNQPISSNTPNAPPMPGYNYIGSLPSSSQVLIAVHIPLKNVDLLYSYAEQVSNPGSQLYHHFLTPAQVEELFYPTSQFHRVLNFLQSKGFQVVFTAADSEIVATGTVGQAEKYLGLTYGLYSNGTYTFYYGEGQILGATVFSSNVSSIFFAKPSDLVILKQQLASLKQAMSSEPVNLTFPTDGYSLKVLQGEYNATYMYKHGFNGSGYNIGILDFYGDPSIYQQLVYFDQHFGIPNPPSFKVVPIGPYDPQLGLTSGWAGEISLDVESSHAMAPGANVTLYIANEALPLPSIIAFIDSQDAVDTLSQSFSIPETYYSQFSGGSFYECVILSDQYYAMGSAEGITFIASSGDAGGSGYSAGPLGTVGYPSTSPFVLSAGGTTVYPVFGPNGTTYNTTAWSNYGFIPNNFNYGGGTGGISEIEPEPWYQWSLPVYKTFPDGRQVPDLSANANVYPGIFIVLPGNQTAIIGGTSEASPLLAGLLTLVMQYSHVRLGLLGPALYAMASNPRDSMAFIEPSFGYNIPWMESKGYNLVTGWGSPNIATFSIYYSALHSSPSLSINVTATYNRTQVQQTYPGQRLTIQASITREGSMVSVGNFVALLESVNGNLTSTQLTFNPVTGNWTGNITIPNSAQGIVNLVIYGESAGVYGAGSVELFSGYFAQFLCPVQMKPYMANEGIPIVLNITNTMGAQAPPINYTVSVYSYNLTNNSYTLLSNVKVVPVPAVLIVPAAPPSTFLWVGLLNATYPPGVMRLVVNGAFGYVSFYNGIDLQTMFILPPVVAEPGSVPAGSYVYIFGKITPPIETFGVTSVVDEQSVASNVMVGSNVTAELYGPNGIISSTQLSYNTTSGQYQGYLHVPANVKSGLYDILLFADYNSTTLGTNIQGYFYGQIYVSKGAIEPAIKVSNYYAFQGQRLYVYANITDPATGREITTGMFVATLYPATLSYEYFTLTGIQDVPLWYNQTLSEWVGNVTLPSTSNLNNFTYLGTSDYFATPFEVYVSGLTPNGIPTTTSQSTQYTFFVTPYSQVQNSIVTDPIQPYYTAFDNDTIMYNGTLTNDVFMGHNYIENSVTTLVSSNISGELTIMNSNVVLTNVIGNDIVAVNSHITLVDSDIRSLTLVHSTVTLEQSEIQTLMPSLPSITFVSPTSVVSGNVMGQIEVTGNDISNVTVLLDGAYLASTTTNGTFTFPINSLNYPDGTYTITVIARQSDGLSSSKSEQITFNNQLINISNKISNVSSSLTSEINHLTNTSQEEINHVTSTSQDLGYTAVGIGVIAIIIAIVALFRRR